MKTTRVQSVFKPQQIETGQITFSPPRILPNGGKIIYLQYEKKKLVMQTPKMSVPFGLNCYLNKDGSHKYTLSLSFQNVEDSDFYKFIQSLDEWLVKAGVANSLPWFQTRQISPEAVRSSYSSQIKFSKGADGEINHQYAPTFRIKLPYRQEGGFDCEVYDHNRDLIETDQILTALPKRTKVQALIQCTGLWFAGGKFGCSWKALQLLKVADTKAFLSNYAFLDDSDED